MDNQTRRNIRQGILIGANGSLKCYFKIIVCFYRPEANDTSEFFSRNRGTNEKDSHHFASCI
eukprot:08162.XXX_160632_160814_1 [CDS] Oithona nana genome sequencing.